MCPGTELSFSKIFIFHKSKANRHNMATEPHWFTTALEGKQWLSLISYKSSAACQVQRPYNPLYWKMTRTLASSQSPSDTTLKQWTNVNIVHISSMNSILRENCFPKHFKSTYELNLATIIGGVYVTQTMRDGIAQVTKRQVFWRWSQLCHCLCRFHHLFFHFRTFCEHFVTISGVLNIEFLSEHHIYGVFLRGGLQHILPWEQWCATHISFPLKGLEVTSLLLKGRH